MSARSGAMSRPAKGTKAPEQPVLDYGPLQGYIGYHLRRAADTVLQTFARRTGETELRPGRFALLLLISRNPNLNQTSLSLAVGRDKSTLTPALRDLERRGLILRQRVQGDQRAYTLKLTGRGKRTLGDLQRLARAHEAQLDKLVGSHKALLCQMLRRLTTALPTPPASSRRRS